MDLEDGNPISFQGGYGIGYVTANLDEDHDDANDSQTPYEGQ